MLFAVKHCTDNRWNHIYIKIQDDVVLSECTFTSWWFSLCVCVCLQPRQTVLTAAGSIGQASGDLLRQIGESETDERFQVNAARRPFIISTALCVLFEKTTHTHTHTHKTLFLRNCHSVNQKHTVTMTRGILSYFSWMFLFNLSAFLAG